MPYYWLSLLRGLKRNMSTSSTKAGRSFDDAVTALNSLQSNFTVLEALRAKGPSANVLAIPEMVEWLRRIDYKPSDLNKLNIVHIAGTKGKGSTCAFTASIISQYLNRGVNQIGLYTSPHLRSVCERINLNGSSISEELFARYFFQIWDRIEASESPEDKFPQMGPGIKPSYFRYLTLMSFHVFLSEGVDSAVYEVGVGGEYDSTNVIQKPTVCGISSLGIDHTSVLGNSIKDIAWHKAGIFKKGVPAFSSKQPLEAWQVLLERAKERETTVTEVDIHPELKDVTLGLAGNVQKINASLAIQLAKTHLEKLGIKVPQVTEKRLSDEFINGLQKTEWPGRCQTILEDSIRWLIDGAHTAESVLASVGWFIDLSRNHRGPRVLIFNQQNRDGEPLINVIHQQIRGILTFDHVIFCTNVTYSSGKYAKELTANTINKKDLDTLKVQRENAELWKKLEPASKVHVKASIQEAVEVIRGLEERLAAMQSIDVYVTGSLHLVGGLLVVLDK